MTLFILTVLLTLPYIHSGLGLQIKADLTLILKTSFDLVLSHMPKLFVDLLSKINPNAPKHFQFSRLFLSLTLYLILFAFGA